MYAETMKAAKAVQSPFRGTGALSASTKDAFDEIIEKVKMANDGAPVVIMGTNSMLKKINKLADVQWSSNGQKDDMAAMGRLGAYEGDTLIEIPQRFALNDVTKTLVDNETLLIMPQVDNKFVKFVDQGETEITEVTEKAARMDDTMTYEVQRSMGIATQFGLYFGVWTVK